ncbi:3-deoxy-D-manno-octulosonic acid transferase, family GT30 [Zostera marina]|uniref:lipid IVA 3-deoxy-D-manno-octulosonic acid transferase n=1 Tax=Zostera marina TaxID=29655 RepID=A0A0K9PTN8_ZOSMR|nr:3-deoxy-D-manno-octulosonic acid transferase, family GT30 [Zostera marina]
MSGYCNGSWVAYSAYRWASTGVAPLVHNVLLPWRRFRGLEHHVRGKERLGYPTTSDLRCSRIPSDHLLLWFHAVSLGEGLAAVPLITHCLLQRKHQEQPFTILMTTTTVSAFDVVDAQLPQGVIHQFAPVDTPAAVARFLNYWNPTAIFLLESELWPNLILAASARGIAVALLNARMSEKSFKLWSLPVARSLISLMLSKLSLIVTVSTTEAVRFQLLHASPFIINFSRNLKYAINFEVPEVENRKIKDLKLQLAERQVWMASSIHPGEEEVMLWIHNELVKKYANLVTIIVPRHPHLGKEIAKTMYKIGAGSEVLLRSESANISPSTKIYIIDTLGELKYLYKITPIAVIGGSFLPNLAGHNVSEAAASGCALLTGPYVGHFCHMISEMLQLEPMSVRQVSNKVELLECIMELLSNPDSLEARRTAAKQAFEAISGGVVENVWDLISTYILGGADI